LAPSIALEPDLGRAVVVRFAAGAAAPVVIAIQLEAPVRVGGGILFFGVQVPAARPPRLEGALKGMPA
jgi:hypothetical protein